MHRTTLATVSQAMHNFLLEKGLDADEIFVRAGLDPKKIFDADARFPVYGMNRVWLIAEQESKSPTIIYDVMPKVELQMLHAMGHAWVASRNLEEALERFVRYYRILSTNIELKLDKTASRTILTGRSLEVAGRVANEGGLVFCLHVCKLCFGEDLVPAEVRLIRSQPEDCSLIDKFYNCPIEYDCDGEVNTIEFNSVDMTRRLTGANAEIVLAMEDVITNYLSRFDANDVVSRVRRAVAKKLVYSEPTKQELADELNMAPRTLQRRLEEQESSVKEIIDDTRHHLATEYLAQDHYSVKEVAFSLGFSDPSNFARAFKRWEGLTPKEFRNSL